jgi:phage tail-like protein
MTTETAVQPTREEKPMTKVRPSRYLKYLPTQYSTDDFLGRFLRIFESILDPIEEIVTSIDSYFDPVMAPPHVLPWLASWLSLVLDEEWPLEKRRHLISRAVELYQLRGTLRGLMEYLAIYSGVQPIIVEHYGGIRLGRNSQLGWNTVLGDGRQHSITVNLRVGPQEQIDLRKVKTIIEAEKPAHVAYALEIAEAVEDQESRAGGEPC